MWSDWRVDQFEVSCVSGLFLCKYDDDLKLLGSCFFGLDLWVVRALKIDN